MLLGWVVKEAQMQKNLATLVMPAVLAVFSCAPAFAQVRVGLDLGAVRIRIAPEAPPRPRWERRTTCPGPNYIWIAGYWDRQGDQWGWAPGRWEEPSQRGSTWIRPQYRREGRAYRYEPGRWSHQRMEEGDDYSHWRAEHGRGHDNGRGRGRDRERDDHHRGD